MAVLNIVIEAFLHSVEFQYHEIKKTQLQDVVLTAHVWRSSLLFTAILTISH